MVDTDDTRQTTPGLWHELPRGDLKKCELDITTKASILGVGCSISQVWNIVCRHMNKKHISNKIKRHTNKPPGKLPCSKKQSPDQTKSRAHPIMFR